ncbi:MAG: DUF6457 domain-containing protein [Actinobacteria bacterium]|nr:DUF6457 domain-containing protein [Actinomycetota bacterium]
MHIEPYPEHRRPPLVEQTDPAIAWTKQVVNALEVRDISPQEMDEVLALAGEVAHGTSQRSLAPLTTFLAGLYTARRSADTEPLAEVRRIIASLLEAYDRG